MYVIKRCDLCANIRQVSIHIYGGGIGLSTFNSEKVRVDTSAGGLLVTEGIIRLVVIASALTWLIMYY